jgi:hypothetical protein
MNIREFASKMRLRVKRDECGELIIPGRRGHIYQHNDSFLGLAFMPGKSRLWANAKKKFSQVGITVRQDGDDEGTALFDPLNPAQVRLAMKVITLKRRRIPSPSQLEALRKATAALQRHRTHRAEGRVGVKDRHLQRLSLLGPGAPREAGINPLEPAVADQS